jgi:hypothetical protein
MSVGPCPLCGESLYPWLTAPVPAAGVLDRCEGCGVALARDGEVDLQVELEAVADRRDDGALVIAAPNRRSVQAALGEAGWAGLAARRGRFVLTPGALELLLERNGLSTAGVGSPPVGKSQAWMWQTLMNALTLRANFAADVRAGRVHPAGWRQRTAFAIDVLVTVLAAPLIALVSFPLELVASLLGRGGQLVATARPSRT